MFQHSSGQTPQTQSLQTQPNLALQKTGAWSKQAFSKKTRLIATLFSLCCLVSTSFFLPLSSKAADIENTCTVLNNSWQGYKTRFIQADGRVVDHSAQGSSTSEGQAYALLRAVWMDDLSTFQKVYQWTKSNLAVRNDHLHAWRWGRQDLAHTATQTGKPSTQPVWGVLDSAFASDADQDIALALLMASERWPTVKELYEADAKLILTDLWQQATLPTPIGRILLPSPRNTAERGTWTKINPSYFFPLAYRIFGEADQDHPWAEVAQGSYAVLNAIHTRSDLPPDWVNLNTATGDIALFGIETPLDTQSDYGFEALRLHWRLGFDILFLSENAKNKTVRQQRIWALETLKRSGIFLGRYWALQNKLPLLINPDGILRENTPDSPSVYGTALLPIELIHSKTANDIVSTKLSRLYKADGYWGDTKDYYSQNLIWFGMSQWAYWQAQQGNKERDDLSKNPKALLKPLSHLMTDTCTP